MSEAHEKHDTMGLKVPQALSRTIHIGVPIAATLLILAFAVVSFQPANKNALPPESTLVFIPVYLTIVVVLVFSSLYLFKRLLDTETEAKPEH